MLISGILEAESELLDDGGKINDHNKDSENQDNYRTADELFEIMAMTSNFNAKDEDVLTPGDLVLLYQNIDVGTQLMSANEMNSNKTNQYVETVIYQDENDSIGSDISEMNSTEDLHNTFLINNKNIDLLRDQSYEDTLCQKHGFIKLQHSHLTNDFGRHLFFQDSLTKNQFKSLNCLSNEFENSVIPSSLLDYILCKRLEDNYNFNMDNIIKYVKHTIDQLKKISNGDYLTEKAKEKWFESEKQMEICKDIVPSTKKSLTNVASIPLHIERKDTKAITTWDDIVRSEVDLRSLCKLLEKKIIIEIPKQISGSFKLFSKCCTDSVIIRCKQDTKPKVRNNKCPQVDVVFQLQRSKSGHLLSNISSIMILQKESSNVHEIDYKNDILPLPYKEQDTFENCEFPIPEVNEISGQCKDDNIKDQEPMQVTFSADTVSKNETIEVETQDEIHGNYIDNSSINSYSSATCQLNDYLNDDIATQMLIDEKASDLTNLKTTTVNNENSQSSLPEEFKDLHQISKTNKRKSPTNVKRVKSPYENKSHILEEKKRKRLLEIREKRERRKIALSDITKGARNRKYCKGSALPQTSSSVTKLSITNKSFYNSIFGENNLTNLQKPKSERRKDRKENVVELLNKSSSNFKFSETIEYNRNKECDMKVNNNIDESVTTAVMCFQLEDVNPNVHTMSTSASTQNRNTDFNNFDNHNICNIEISDQNCEKDNGYDSTIEYNNLDAEDLKSHDTVPTNSPNRVSKECSTSKEAVTTLECRKSIDKIYSLLKTDKYSNENVINSSNIVPNEKPTVSYQDTSIVLGSDSGTSLKHLMTSSSPSTFSFERPSDKSKLSVNKKKQSSDPIVPKIVISTKFKATSQEYIDKANQFHKENKLVLNAASKINPNNPLKAISQILHEFDNVQKIKQKSFDDSRSKTTGIKSAELKSQSRQGSCRKKTLRKEQDVKSPKRFSSPRDKTKNVVKDGKEKRSLLVTSKFDNINVKHSERLSKNNITDATDAAKEARGEAVRGPSRNNLSRINALAQPRRLYVQAHSEEFQNKYGRNLMADRLQRLASTQQSTERNNFANQSRGKLKKLGCDTSSVSVKPLEKYTNNINKKIRNSSPENKVLHLDNETSSKTMLCGKSEPRKINKIDSQYPHLKHCLQTMKRSRVPPVPMHVEFGYKSDPSASPSPTEKASLLGVKLHQIVNNMINPITVKELTDLPEYTESLESSVYDVDENVHVVSCADKTITTIEDFTDSTEKEDESSYNPSAIIHEEVKLSKNKNEAHDLYAQNDKPLDSGVTSSIIAIKSSLSLHFKSRNEVQAITDGVPHSKSKPDVMWPLSAFPLQVTTVGYAFPSFSMIRPNSIPKIQVIRESPKFCRLNTIEKIDRPTQVAEIKEEQKEQSLQTNNDILKIKKSLKLLLENEFCQTDDYNKTILENIDPKDNIGSLSKNNVDTASSLDVLVNLLNEIQNITMCQTQMTNTINVETESLNRNVSNIVVRGNAKNFENKAYQIKPNIISVGSLDKLRHLESGTSIYSIYVCKDEDVLEHTLSQELKHNACRSVACSVAPITVMDKEVSTNTNKNNCVSCYTDVPSRILPITTNQETNVSNSIIGIFSQPSSQCLLTYHEFETMTRNTSVQVISKIIEIPTFVENTSQPDSTISKRIELNQNQSGTKEMLKSTEYKRQICQNLCNYNSLKSEEDPVKKLKRDILVTVYSILVFTVFAALSFPEFIQGGF